MADVQQSVINQPYPYVNGKLINGFPGSNVALVGQVDKIDGQNMVTKTTDGKQSLLS